MANQRYYLRCKCGELKFMGKSLGRGIYNTSEDKVKFLENIYEWMWKHIWSCVDPAGGPGPEWSRDRFFEVVGEYDSRVDYSILENKKGSLISGAAQDA